MSYKTYGIKEITSFAHQNLINKELNRDDVIIALTGLELNAVESALKKGGKYYAISKQFDAHGKFENFIIVIK